MKCNGRAASAEVRPGLGEGEGELSECSECRECNCLLLNSFIPVPAPLRCSAGQLAHNLLARVHFRPYEQQSPHQCSVLPE